MFRAIGCRALIAAAGLCICFSGPSHAVESEGAQESARAEEPVGKPVVLKKYVKRAKYARASHSRKIARTERTASRRKAKLEQTADVSTDVTSNSPTATSADATAATIPPTIANANAQWVGSPQSAAELAARGMSAQADSVLRVAQAESAAPGPIAGQGAPDMANSDIVASDQLNDVDRSLSEASPAPTQPGKATVAMAAQHDNGAAVAAPTRTVSQASNVDNSAWDQTSLIGKVFIAFGGLLTLASAARMFLA